MTGNNEATQRLNINKILQESGWVLLAEDGVVNVEVEKQNEAGSADYVLYGKQRIPLCVVEAKRQRKDPLSGKEQARKYAEALNCRFVILSNGALHYLWDLEQGHPAQKDFPTQSELELIKEKFNPSRKKFEEIEFDYLARAQLRTYDSQPEYLDESKREAFLKENKIKELRDYQVKAVKAIQSGIEKNESRFLLEMATGTGKTLVSCAIIRMFMRYYKVNRVLFLVDRLELASQAETAFNEALSKDGCRAVIWKENKNDWEKAEIVVSTVQSFVSNDRYRRDFRQDDFQLVISDEAHRSLGRKSRKVFEYFIGFKLGLTATPKDFLKSVDTKELAISDPRQLERRLMLDTYTTFGCENGEPTFSYSLEDGVEDGNLVKPKVFDARTDITTELLSKKGYLFSGIDKDGNEYEVDFKQGDYEKKFFSENTNRTLCKAFLMHALRDPYTNEIGKTLIFCVSQKHAAKITQILNEEADKHFPNIYNSDFAIQVTSDVDDAQRMTVNFRNNKLRGESEVIPDYGTSKARVCVTVGMMTTGYDCSDVLNICLLRPIYSPSEFIQIKGRGTRTFDFSHSWKVKSKIDDLIESKKEIFYLFDFFGNYHYFQNEFKYHEVLKLPQEGSDGPDEPPTPRIDGATSTIADDIKTVDVYEIPNVGMRVDREFFPSFRAKMQGDEIIKAMVDNQEFEEAEIYLNDNIWDKPKEYFTLERIRKDLLLDRYLTVTEILLYTFGYIDYLPSQQECLDEEFEKFDKAFKLGDSIYDDARKVFEAYASNDKIKKIIDSEKFAGFGVQRIAGRAFKNLPPELRKAIPAYIATIADIERLKNAR